jgi:hypothetical protein
VPSQEAIQVVAIRGLLPQAVPTRLWECSVPLRELDGGERHQPPHPAMTRAECGKLGLAGAQQESRGCVVAGGAEGIRTPDLLHAMPSASLHKVLRLPARHRISPGQGAGGTRRRGVTQGWVKDRC